jgi:phosphatidate cytidylyltransferase
VKTEKRHRMTGQKNKPFSETATRAVSGFFYVIAWIGLAMVGHWPLWIGMIVVSGCMWFEINRIFTRFHFPSVFWPGLAILLLGFLVNAFYPEYRLYLILLAFWPLIWPGNKHQKTMRFLWFFFIATPFLLLSSYGMSENYRPERLMLLLIVIWANDTFAYLGGRKWGKHKIAPLISPKKTWEGFSSGWIAGILLAIFLGYFWLDDSPITWGIIAFVLIPPAVLGDFWESAVKRQAGLKDSGRFLPGHGGWLDRFDSFLLSIPLVYFIFTTLLL